MSMTKTIPKKMRDEMSQDNFYKVCCLAGFGMCDGKIEWHHGLIFAGQRVNEPFAILPVCEMHHDQEKNVVVREKLDFIMWERAGAEKRKFYSRAIDVEHRYQYLKKKYGK